jgi:hypothetical protein
MVTQSTNEVPKKLVLFDEIHEGYWTGDNECGCFNPISPLNDSKSRENRHAWYNACTYISLDGLDPHKKYKVTLHIEAEEIV